MPNRILTLASIGAILVFGVLAVQHLLHLLQGGPLFHTMETGTFALLSAIGGAVLYRSRRTPLPSIPGNPQGPPSALILGSSRRDSLSRPNQPP